MMACMDIDTDFASKVHTKIKSCSPQLLISIYNCFDVIINKLINELVSIVSSNFNCVANQ